MKVPCARIGMQRSCVAPSPALIPNACPACRQKALADANHLQVMDTVAQHFTDALVRDTVDSMLAACWREVEQEHSMAANFSFDMIVQAITSVSRCDTCPIVHRTQACLACRLFTASSVAPACTLLACAQWVGPPLLVHCQRSRLCVKVNGVQTGPQCEGHTADDPRRGVGTVCANDDERSAAAELAHTHY